MPFKQLPVQATYISAQEVDDPEHERLKVTLEDGAELYYRLSTTSAWKDTLELDYALSNRAIVDALLEQGRHVLDLSSGPGVRKERRRLRGMSRDELLTVVMVRMSVLPGKSSFDESPEVGKPLRGMLIMHKQGGTWNHCRQYAGGENRIHHYPAGSPYSLVLPAGGYSHAENVRRPFTY